jgi:hypothetical protein
MGSAAETWCPLPWCPLGQIVGKAQPFGRIRVSLFRLPAAFAPGFKEAIKMKRAKVRSAVAPAGLPLRWVFAAAAGALTLLAIPHAGHAQGIVRGAQQGAHEGNRVAGPVGGVVGGAVGAGVGGAVGAVEGVFGVPHRGWHHRCHGYRDRYGYFHCYR